MKNLLSVAPSSINSTSTALLSVDTSHDGNGNGNQQTLLGWNDGGKYSHYFRGKGTTYFGTAGGVRIDSGLNMNYSTISNVAYLNVKTASANAVGQLYTGTGGMVVQGEAGYNLHLGANNRSNDVTIYGASGETARVKTTLPLEVGGKLSSTGNVHTATNGGFISDSGYIVIRSAADNHVYLQGSQVRAVVVNTTTTYRPMYASAFNVSSQEKFKEDITPIEQDESVDVMEMLKTTNVYTYKLTEELERGIDKKKIGLIVEQAQADLSDEEDEAIELYQMASTLWEVCKKQQEAIEQLQQQIKEMKGE